jgi:DNA-binding FrmR family transcriptional regulator
MTPLVTKADLVRRLRCAEGHLRGITAMVERGADCESLVSQTLAVQAALGKVNRLILKYHLETCLREPITNTDISARNRRLSEIVALYQLLSQPNSIKERI